jgi:hypothetical protein
VKSVFMKVEDDFGHFATRFMTEMSWSSRAWTYIIPKLDKILFQTNAGSSLSSDTNLKDVRADNTRRISTTVSRAAGHCATGRSSWLGLDEGHHVPISDPRRSIQNSTHPCRHTT